MSSYVDFIESLGQYCLELMLMVFLVSAAAKLASRVCASDSSLLVFVFVFSRLARGREFW